jgi:hypothetical protein
MGVAMIPHITIALGFIVGIVFIVVFEWWMWRRSKR